MKPATYDGTGLWNDYLSHFESVSLINHWTDLEKGLYLAASLRGQAQGVLGNQATGDRQNYQKLIQALQDRFAPSNQTELYRAQLREGRQKASETLPEMGQEIRHLTNLAYPTASSELKEVLATEQFLDGLFDPEMRLKIKQARPVNLNDAIQRAVELEAFSRAERRRKEHVHVIVNDKDSSEKRSRMEALMTEMQKSIKLLQQEIQTLKKERNQRQGRDGPSGGYSSADGNRGPGSVDQRCGPGNRDKRCYNCQSPGHIARNCPNRTNEEYTDAGYKEGHQDKSEQSYCNIHIIKESGLYVKALVGGMETSLLIDTGATISLLSRVLFEALLKDQSYELKGVSEPILSVNETPLDVLGQTEVGITIGESRLQQAVVIANIHVDGILGMDFLKECNCIIDLQRDTLSVSGMEHPLRTEGLSRPLKVSVICPPDRETFESNKGSKTWRKIPYVLKDTQARRRRKRKKHKKMIQKLINQKHEFSGNSVVRETLDGERIGDGGETSNLDPDVWTHGMGSLDASEDKGLARIPSSLSETTDQELVASCIRRQRMQPSSFTKTRMKTSRSLFVGLVQSDGRLVKNLTEEVTHIKSVVEMSGPQGNDLGLTIGLSRRSDMERRMCLLPWLQ